MPTRHIIFGLSLDAPTYPGLLVEKLAVIGQVQCGPTGLLQTLETRLGQIGKWESEPFRTEIYRRRLLAADDKNRFYSRSLETDAYMTSQTLLAWRDELIRCGWDFFTLPSLPNRLRDLAAVEAVTPATVPAVPAVPAGFSDRFRKVLSALPSDQLHIETITMTDPRAFFDPPLQHLFEKLEQCGIQIQEAQPRACQSAGDLGQLQTAIETNASVSAAGDGSVVILRTGSDTEAADLLGALLAETPSDDQLLIIPPGDQTLDRVLTARGLPAGGISSWSSQRPILQVLPILCELLWEPLDPDRLLEFLSLPDIPVPRWVARKLADAVAKAPGIGGKPWKNALSDIETKAASYSADGGTVWPDIKKSIATWIEGVRYPLAMGVPREALSELAERIAHWAGKKPIRAGENDNQAAVLDAQAGHLAKIAASLPEEHIRKPQLQRLLQQIMGEGQAIGKKAEAGHPFWVGSPDAIIGPAQEIIWWGFTSTNEPALRRLPLLGSEIAFLHAAGVFLPDPLEALHHRIAHTERAVTAAGNRLVLVMPECQAGMAVEPHPLYDRLSVIFGESLAKLEMSGAEWLKRDRRLAGFSQGAVLERFIPKPSRFWYLAGNDTLPPRDTESYTSLSTLFNMPVSWVLKYIGCLQQGPIQVVSNYKFLMGTLAHRVFEELFPAGTTCKSWTKATVQKNVETILTRLIESEGCVFLQPDRVSEKQILMDRIQRAAWVMVQHIRDNGWTVVGTEQSASGALGNQNIIGNVDLLLDKPDGSLAVVDLKWGKSKYLRENIQDNRSYQLALYAHMLKRNGSLPHVAYFSLSEAQMVAPDRTAFKDAWIAEPPDGEILESLIVRMQQTFAFRRFELDSGMIEVPVEGTTPDTTVDSPADILIDHKRTHDPGEFRALIGWPEGNHA